MTNLQIDLKEKLWEVYETVGQHFVDLMVSLLAMVIVARSFSLSGLGIFSYLVGVYHIASFISEAGVCDFFKNRCALAEDKEMMARECASALLCSGIFVFLVFLATAMHNSSFSHIEESAVAYILIGVAVPLRNGNSLRTALLHASGRHREVSRLLVKKNLLFLGLIFLVSTAQIPVLLVAVFVFIEVYFQAAIRKRIKIKGALRGLSFRKNYLTMKESLRHLFSGEALNLIFYTDLFVLGLFIQSAELGVYAEAALLARFFLMIPVGIRPILHRHLANYVALGKPFHFSKSVSLVRAYIFYAHALMALLLMVYFDDIVHFIFAIHGTEATSYTLFVIMLPGFLFYSAAIVNESALEACGQAPFLSRVSGALIGLNVFLNFYFIPFAGVRGAATSTLFCLLVYFFMLCLVKITTYSKVQLLEFITGGAVLYLLQKLIVWGNPPFYLFALGVPPILFLVFYLLKLFDIDNSRKIAQATEQP